MKHCAVCVFDNILTKNGLCYRKKQGVQRGFNVNLYQSFRDLEQLTMWHSY